LIDLFAIPAQKNLKALLNNELSKHENVVLFNKNLDIINNCLEGMSLLYFEKEDKPKYILWSLYNNLNIIYIYIN